MVSKYRRIPFFLILCGLALFAFPFLLTGLNIMKIASYDTMLAMVFLGPIIALAGLIIYQVRYRQKTIANIDFLISKAELEGKGSIVAQKMFERGAIFLFVLAATSLFTLVYNFNNDSPSSVEDYLPSLNLPLYGKQIFTTVKAAIAISGGVLLMKGLKLGGVLAIVTALVLIVDVALIRTISPTSLFGIFYYVMLMSFLTILGKFWKYLR